jgi:hypothetical protein
MKSIAYADGIHNITLVDGVVRFELLELTPQPNGAEPTAVDTSIKLSQVSH